MGKQTYFYHDKPVFGLDIGYNSISVMQLAYEKNHQPRLQGYGTTEFNGSVIKDGVIEKPKVLIKALEELFAHHITGRITTRRVAITIPSYRAFTRTINLPKLSPKDLRDAALSEAEQYVPMPLNDLYLDYEIIKTYKDSFDLLVVAIPKRVIDSYMRLAQAVSLEPILIETSMHAAARLFAHDRNHDVPTAIIDFGSLSSDIGLCDHDKLLVLGTVQGGGEVFSHNIAKSLDISLDAATIIKNKYGLGASKKQQEIVSALTPTIDPIIKEVRRVLRYYQDHFPDNKPINQVLILGSGSNMPGLGSYLTDQLRLPVRSCEPWQYFNAHRLKTPVDLEKPKFSTVCGLSLINPKEVFDD